MYRRDQIARVVLSSAPSLPRGCSVCEVRKGLLPRQDFDSAQINPRFTPGFPPPCHLRGTVAALLSPLGQPALLRSPKVGESPLLVDDAHRVGQRRETGVRPEMGLRRDSGFVLIVGCCVCIRDPASWLELVEEPDSRPCEPSLVRKGPQYQVVPPPFLSTEPEGCLSSAESVDHLPTHP